MTQTLQPHQKRWVGKPLHRIDALPKTTGETKFSSDIRLPGMLYAKLFRSNQPHALIKKLDTSKAESHPKVRAVITHKDIPGINGYGLIKPDQPVLCEDKVRCIGDPIAAVAAETKEALEEAIATIKVDYEPLPVILDPEEALSPNAVKIHEKGNLLRHAQFSRGNVEVAFHQAAIVVEQTYHTSSQAPMYLETEAGVSFVDPDGNIVLYVGGQGPYRDKEQLARALAMPPEKIRVVSTQVGGAFGGKDEVTVHIPIAILAMKTGRPVKMVWTREESGVTGLKRHAMKITVKTAANLDGSFLANKVRIVADTGAYASMAFPVLDIAMENSCGPYKFPNVQIDGLSVYTNSGVAGAMRGFGAPQACFAIESQVDLIAAALNLDPLYVRKKNAIRRGDMGPFGAEIRGSTGILEALEAVEKHEIWRERSTHKKTATKPWIKIGVGVAAAVKGVGVGTMPDRGSARIEILPDGKFKLGVSCPEIGQGNMTACTQIAAEALECTPQEIEINAGDSSLSPNTCPSSASRTVYISGNAIIKAAEKVQALLILKASDMTGEPKELLICKESAVRSSRNPSVCTSYRQIAENIHRNGLQTKIEGSFEVPRFEKAVEGTLEIPHWSYMYAACSALVEVNTLTGKTKVIKFFIAPDGGRVMNLQGYIGQCEGGVVQGLGYSLYEEVIMEKGQIKTTNFTTYIIPTITDVPEIETFPIETYEETGPFGAKGIGEIPFIPVAPAITNAIHDAAGIRLTTIPATPERVYWKLKEQEQTHSTQTR